MDFRMKKFFSTLLSALLLSSTAFAGGTIPQRMGMEKGKIVPSNSELIRWDYYGNLSPEFQDMVAWAVASVDVETLETRLLFGKAMHEVAVVPNTTILRFRGMSDVTDPECLDADPGGCTYATAFCLTSVATTIANVKVCSLYRVDVFVNNIIAGAAKKQLSIAEFAHGVFRHEVVHVLGFSHSDNYSEGPMTNGQYPLTPCQKQTLVDFNIDPSTTVWLTVPSCLGIY
jgi:hypothetical protein